MPRCMKHLERVARCLERLSILQKHIRFQMQTAALKLDGQVLIRIRQDRLLLLTGINRHAQIPSQLFHRRHMVKMSMSQQNRLCLRSGLRQCILDPRRLIARINNHSFLRLRMHRNITVRLDHSHDQPFYLHLFLLIICETFTGCKYL